MHTIQTLKNKTMNIVLSVLIALALAFCAVAAIGVTAYADEVEDIKEFATASLDLGNADFGSSSGNYPASPTSWTGAAADNGKGNVVSGVVDLKPSVYSDSKNGNKKFKLDQYPEYKNETDIPKTIFGEDTQYGGDEKALLINTVDGAKVAYAYTSADMTLSPNSFYRFSVWVKTGDFAGQTGATVKLTGLGQSFAFHGVNTVRNNLNDDGELKLDQTNNYGWVKYSMYVRTSASLTKTVKLVLGIGDAVQGNDEDPDIMPRPASGYAFFDTVKAERISAFSFASETEHFVKTENKNNVYKLGDNALAINLCETKSMTTEDGDEIGTFSQNTELWKTNIYYNEYETDHEYAGSARNRLYNSQSRIKDLDSAYNTNGFTQNPWAPYGRAEYDVLNGSPFFEGENIANIMLITTYDGDEFQQAAYGIASPFVKINRFKYYRFSVWVKGDNVSDGSGITILLRGRSANAQKATELTKYTNLEGDSSDAAHYGWKEQVVYIHGSMLFDYDVSFELWLGTPDSRSSGIAMFDNVTFTELDYSDYSEMSAADGGNVFSVDNIENSTNITNGNFINVGDMDEFKFPMAVADWTYYTTDTVKADGFSTKAVDADNVVHGIIPTDEATFDSIRQLLPSVDRPNEHGLANVLLLSSVSKTAVCYQSPSVTLATDKANKLSVDLRVSRIVGYGASLVLKTTDGAVLATIENITDTGNKFKTFTFYLAAPLSEQTVNVEIWLGLNDRTDNSKKLSSGNVYVKQVKLDEWTAADENGSVQDEYNALLEEYKFAVSHPSALKSLDYGMYSFTAPTLDYYDAYSYVQDRDELGYLYQWTMHSSDTKNVKSGMFNASYKKNMDIYPGFESKDYTGNMLYIYNTDKNYTRYTYDNSVALVANKYYRIDVAVKVRVADEVRTDKNSVGATIKLTGSSAEFANIKDTTTLKDKNNEDSRDYETFKTYTFYISTGDNGGNIGMEISLGGEDRDSRIQGRLVIGDITMTEIDNLDYENAKKAVKKNKNTVAVELSETDNTKDDNTDTEPASSEIQWWIIPTVIFSAALVAVVVLILVMRLRDRIKRKKTVTYTSEYDRNDVLRDIERLKAQDDNAKITAPDKKDVLDDDYEEQRPEQKQDATPETTEEPIEEEKPATEEGSVKASPANDDLDD